MRMSRRALSALLSAALCLSLLPVSARAAVENITVGGEEFTLQERGDSYYQDAYDSYNYMINTAADGTISFSARPFLTLDCNGGKCFDECGTYTYFTRLCHNKRLIFDKISVKDDAKRA